MKTKFIGEIQFEVEYPKNYKIISDNYFDVYLQEMIEDYEFLIFDQKKELEDERFPSKVKVKIKKV